VTITLREAHAALGPSEARFDVEAGVVLRGEIRRAAARLGVDWFEQKGWFESYFIFRGPAARVRLLFDALKAIDED
jgi:hypothetical protein